MIKKLFKKNLILTMVLTLLLAINSIQFPALASNSGAVTQITIFHTNDMHGHLLDSFNSAKPPVLTQIGSDYTATIKKSVPNSLLIDAGDATQGVPFATVSKGADIIKLMNAEGYDGMVLGNHEFDYGKDQALSNAKLASFPVISANTMDNGQPFLSGVNGNNGEDFIKTVNGVKVGFFGITTQETVYKTSPASIPGITFEDPIKVSKDEVSKLKSEGASVIVGIMHLGNDSSSSPISEDIAKAVDGINVIIDGHSHTVENKLVNNTLIAQTGCYNSNVGRIDVSIGSDGKVSAAENLISAAAATTAYSPDQTVAALAKQASDSQKAMFSQKVGRTNTSFWSGTVNGQSISRLVETNLGDLVADAMVDGGKSQISGTEYASLPVVALENGGGVRDSIPAGDINQGQITTVLPFGNILSLKEVTPALLYQVLENGVSKITIKDTSTGVISGADGRFPQISGMRFEYNPLNPVSNRITKIVLLNSDGSDKNVLDKNDTATKIVLVSNDYEVGGGDGYTMLGSLKNIGEGNALDVVTAQYITKLTSQNGGAFLYPDNEGRIKISSDFNYNPYTAAITIKNGQNLVSANSSITYAIDNGNAVQAVVGDNGVITISNLPSGPHSVSVLYNNLKADVYINNVIGSNKAADVVASLVGIDPAISKETDDMISALPSNIVIPNNDAIAKARASYDKLTLAQKSLVANYSKLTNAEAVITKLTTNVALDKKWTVTMTQGIDYSTLTNSNVTVINNATKKNVEINLIPAVNDNKSFFIQPKSKYNVGTSYTIYIKNLKSTSNKLMKQERIINFTTISQ
ncbi:5'-nucleotidase C-terminal domain-containing protein [Clostridium sp. JS66]|uniref:5'-nucleotidase C-terminal domain-containing protein n=1 Tax=Clostridium sp. JS66 TaxID=3064705 RepID=UPI00298DE944|nr:5'-nucleotidase C-terminal domain-containing protein [Clostridium sp. JS66]WPC44268.1 5'-nucleotidase C-terminal domain-containing protein [Clostridium sp. JS66]